jgi:hypothetical protein
MTPEGHFLTSYYNPKPYPTPNPKPYPTPNPNPYPNPNPR